MSTTASAARAQFLCTACGSLAPKWAGRCPGCGEWNSLEETGPSVTGRGRSHGHQPHRDLVTITRVPTTLVERLPTGLLECDRVLGGGIVAGALVLLGGDPGIGKSTLALQLAQGIGSSAQPALYCVGEESAPQLAMRARRTGCSTEAVNVLAETDLDTLLATIEESRPALAVIDSVQTTYDAEAPGVPGSVSQVRQAVARLLALAKRTGVPILLIGHVTKEGAIAGPRTLEHMVDVVLYLEGERHGEHRLLRGIKNRFGATGEIGLFTMTEQGMEPLAAPGRAFLDEASLRVPGNVLTVTCEGTRSLAVEVQALAAPTPFGLPRRTASGFDIGRLHLLLAVLEKRARVSFGQSDVYVNAVGGVRLVEPAIDLAVALAVAGSVRDRTLPEGTVVLGEVGLGGEVRRVRRLEQRVIEAAALGMSAAIIPAAHDRSRLPRSIRVHPVGGITEAVHHLR